MVRRGERARSRSAESRLASRRVAERDVVDGRESRIAPVARERRVEGAPSIPAKKKPNDRDGSAGLRDSGPAAGRARETRGMNRHPRGSNGGRRRSGDAPREPARRLVVLVFRLFTRASHRDGLERDGAAPGAPGGLQGGHAADGHELKREERHLCGWTVRYQRRQECPRRGGRDDYREIQRSGKKSAADWPIVPTRNSIIKSLEVTRRRARQRSERAGRACVRWLPPIPLPDTRARTPRSSV